MNKEQIKEHLYNDKTSAAIDYVKTLSDEESLAVYAYNYNWDNGFSVPSAILDNDNCSLSIALLLFELADGFTYLESKEADSALPEWSLFIKTLYDRIMSNAFSVGNISFKPELSKAQLFKLKKLLSDDELIFVTPIDGNDCNIYL